MKPLFRTTFQGERPNRLKSDFLSIPPQKRQLFFALALMMITSRIPAQNDTLSSQHQKNTDTENSSMKTLTIIANVPKGSGPVYIAGARPEFGFWNPGIYAMEGGGDMPRSARLKVEAGARVEFKFTLGSWETEALSDEGKVPKNYVVMVGDTDMTFEVDIDTFRDGAKNADAQSQPEVLGELIFKRDVPSEHLGRPRHVAIWTPPGYEDSNERYPVLYMHDGQNLFVPSMSFTGVDWGVDESIVRLVEAGKIPPMIVVGPFNSGATRLQEYAPEQDAALYAKFLIEELKPMIDAEYRTLPDRAHTAVMGSSMGGIVSLYLAYHHHDVFGMAGCLSATVRPPDRSLYTKAWRQDSPLHKVRLWVDYDAPRPTDEKGGYRWHSDEFLKQWDWLQSKNFVIKGIAEDHTEAAWRSRLDEVMLFLFGPMMQENSRPGT
jgi:predicted alpha/beta superfamily hydrolase